MGFLTLTLLLWPLHAGAQPATPPTTRRVLIITGADPNQPGFAIITRSIQSTMRDRSSSRVEFLYELQQRLLDNPESQTGDEELISYLKRKYAGQKIDLVLMMVARRFRTLSEKDPSLFADIPKIFYDFDSERELTNRSIGPNITGVWASVDRHRATLDLALALLPGTRNVVVVSGSSPQNLVVLEQAKADFRPYEDRLEFTYLTGEPIQEMKRRLMALDKTSIVIFTSFASDRASNYYNGPEVLSLLAPASAAPIFGSSDTLMGLGITGGKLLDFETTGKRIGELSSRILAGERPEGIAQETAPSVTTVDWREMQRWRLREESLPPGTVVKFKQQTFWQVYKWYVIGLVTLIVLEAILIGWLLILRTRRRQAEEESLRLAQLANSEHKRLNEIISNVPGIVWESLIDPLTNQRKTTFISDYVRKMLGYTPEEWVSASPGLGLRIMAEEDREKASRESEAVIASGRDGVIQFRWRDKEGRMVWTESYLSPINDSKQNVIGLRGVTLDITQRKLAEQALRFAEERDRAILNAIPDLMFVQTLDGIFLDYHAKDSKDLFAPPQTFLGKNMRDVLPPELVEKIAACFANADDRGEPQILEYTLPMNGTDRWFEARMVRSGENILTVVRDITERVLSEEALRAERELLETLVGQLPASVGLIRGSDLRMQIVNPAYQAIAPGKEMIGKTMDQLWPESRKDLAAICRQVLETGEPYQVIDELNAIRRSPDGPLETGYFSWSLHRVRLPGGDGWGLLNTGWESTQRIQTENTLSEREQLLQAMFGSLSSHVVVLDPSGTITYANRLWNEFAIANEGELTRVSTGVNYLEVCRRAANNDDESTRRVLDGIRAVLTRKSPTFRFEYSCHAPNEKRWFLMQVDPMPPEHGGVVVVHTNITDRKQAELALRESEERFSKAFSANPQPMTISTLAEGRYLNVNDAFLEISGYTRAEVIGHTSLELGIWESLGARGNFLNELKEHGAVVNFESRFRTKDGSLRVLLYSAERLEIGGVECLIGASSDITERQKAEDALRESRARLVLAYQAANMGTFEWNVQTGVNIWSAELEAMYGLEPGKFPGTQSAWLALVHPDDREKALAGVNRAFKTGEPGEGEWRVTWPDGSVHWIYGRFQVFTNTAGAPERLTGINIDITDRKAAESSLRESEERFRNMADTVPAMIWVSGPDKLVTYVNQQWLDFTGRTMEEELGNGWAGGVHPDDLDRCFETYCNAFDRREPFRMEYRLRRADSTFRWVIDSASPSFSPAGEFLGYIGSCMDITGRREQEESLRIAHEEVSRLKNQLEEENVYLQEEISIHKSFDEIIGDSDALKYVLFKIEQVAPTDSTVLITGETGTGKELVASAIHKASNRSDRPFVRVNCGALSQSLIESELFGHEKGAFTGASAGKIGRFELANGATIFLDEIGELPAESQVKMLRVIQEGEFERLGSAHTIKVDVRIIAATNRNLDVEVKKGLFREDLWYRLNVFPITVPPLRQRRDDIPALVEHFVNKSARKLGKVITSVSPSTLKSLRDYSWRGNVRELANVIERAVINSKGPVLRIGEDSLMESTEQTSSAAARTLEEMEREYILRVLEDRAWRIEGPHGAARVLGLNPSTLRTRLIKLGINRDNGSKSDREYRTVSS